MSAGLTPPPGFNLSHRLRGTVFVVAMYGLMLVMGLIVLIPTLASRVWALALAKLYCRMVFVMLRGLCGTRVAIRGPVPDTACVVASKHQSFLDILMFTHALPRPRFIMKKSLLNVPILGLFARQIGCVAIDRSAGGDAVRSMIEGVEARREDEGQTIIFPQGTRVRPGAEERYKSGVLRLHQHFEQPVELAALNTGWFWPRVGVARFPGTAVIQFLGPVPDETSLDEMLEVIEERIEAGYGLLAQEAYDQRVGKT